jgi:hypothetical protein
MRDALTQSQIHPAPASRRDGADREQAVMGDFTAAYVRRALEPRLQGHGTIEVKKSGQWGVTIVHRYVSEWNGREVSMPIAQLRPNGKMTQLYWKRANGRWTAYESNAHGPFVDSLDGCLKEIDIDRWGCFWG